MIAHHSGTLGRSRRAVNDVLIGRIESTSNKIPGRFRCGICRADGGPVDYINALYALITVLRSHSCSSRL